VDIKEHCCTDILAVSYELLNLDVTHMIPKVETAIVLIHYMHFTA